MKKVICNDFPKCGLHLLAKACELLGVPVHDKVHTPYSESAFDDDVTHLFIKRDPRDALISRIAFEGKVITPGGIISRFRQYEAWGVSFVDDMNQYYEWLSDPATYVIDFDVLLTDPKEIRRLADHLGAPYIQGAFELLPGDKCPTQTWMGKETYWKDHWTDDVQRVWSDEGGDQLLKDWGYA
jgi:hypothetical protein